VRAVYCYYLSVDCFLVVGTVPLVMSEAMTTSGASIRVDWLCVCAFPMLTDVARGAVHCVATRYFITGHKGNVTTHLHHAQQSRHCCRSHLRHGSSACLAAGATTPHALCVRHRIPAADSKPQAHARCSTTERRNRDDVPASGPPVLVLLPQPSASRQGRVAACLRIHTARTAS